MVRMRFASQALEELKREDPDTPITLNYIRTLARKGLVPCVEIGRRRLINYDALLEYLANPVSGKTEAAPGIRRIAE